MKICIVKPYAYRIPLTIKYLAEKLEINEDREIVFLLQNFKRDI